MDTLRIGNFINGSFVDERSGDWIPSVNPTLPSDIVASVPQGSSDAVRLAVDAAREAQCGWAKLSGPARADYLYAWADAIQARSAELAEAVVREVGKPIGESKGEVGRCVMILRYFAGEAVREVGEVIPAQVGGALQYSLRQPIGVVGLITPWNFPLAIPLWKAAPALAVGNTVVLKPSEMSSYVAFLLARTAADAGLPPGVFNVVHGTGAAVGGPLIEQVDCVSFTGSGAVGAKIAQTCAARNIKFQTEMGGKNVAIVLKDADLDQAAILVAGGAMRFAGQKCTATSRVIVERSVRDAFSAALKKSIDALAVGDPGQMSTAVGPVISQQSLDKISSAIASVKAPLLHKVSSQPSVGYFVAPVTFHEADIESDLAQKEIFGPVLALFDAEDLDHALELANRTEYGLSASLFTKDLRSALTYIPRIDAGMVRVNADTTGVDPHSPFGGVKGSSSHSREQGPAAKDFYTEVKTVQINP